MYKQLLVLAFSTQIRLPIKDLPKEVVQSIVWLLSEELFYINVHEMVFDDGLYAWG
ncbi:MAG: hypothetical protein P8L83_03460 [Flavobacteriaceae bacterium]|nr:hypothetical protein [Flavobacteriaceae bacterium]